MSNRASLACGEGTAMAATRKLAAILAADGGRIQQACCLRRGADAGPPTGSLERSLGSSPPEPSAPGGTQLGQRPPRCDRRGRAGAYRSVRSGRRNPSRMTCDSEVRSSAVAIVLAARARGVAQGCAGLGAIDAAADGAGSRPGTHRPARAAPRAAGHGSARPAVSTCQVLSCEPTS
jgi:hypothetical protein